MGPSAAVQAVLAIATMGPPRWSGGGALPDFTIPRKSAATLISIKFPSGITIAGPMVRS